MEGCPEKSNQVEDEEEYVLLDLDDVCVHADISANAPFVLSGLDTMNPVLVIGDRLKFIGEYQETIGTCYVFTEKVGASVAKQADGQIFEANSSKEKHIADKHQTFNKEVMPVASLHKILKFRLASENQAEEGYSTDSM